eukprot:6167851-Alexandrium_andersonii.AAC.1
MAQLGLRRDCSVGPTAGSWPAGLAFPPRGAVGLSGPVRSFRGNGPLDGATGVVAPRTPTGLAGGGGGTRPPPPCGLGRTR